MSEERVIKSFYISIETSEMLKEMKSKGFRTGMILDKAVKELYENYKEQGLI